MILCVPNRLGARWPSGLERWLGPATGRFPGRVHYGNFARNFIPFKVSFGGDTKSRDLVLCHKRSHQSALECVTVVDSTTHSKLPDPQSAAAENAALHLYRKKKKKNVIIRHYTIIKFE